MSYLLDTNVISELIKSKSNKNVINWFTSVPEDSLHISVLTIGEIRKGVEKVTENNKKEKYKMWLEHSIVTRFADRLLNINIQVAERWGRLLYDMKRSIPAIDSLIGATALHYDLTLVTRNIKDYQFPQLNCINPWEFK